MNLLRTLSVIWVSIFVFGIASASAEAPKRGAVSVSCSCDDATGQAYVSALHDALARSPLYREVKFGDGVEKDAIKIKIVSRPLDGDASGSSKRTTLSIICMYKGAVVRQLIETCNAIPIASCAEETLAQFDFLTS